MESGWLDCPLTNIHIHVRTQSHTHSHTYSHLAPRSISACTLRRPLALFIRLVLYHPTSNMISCFRNAHTHMFHHTPPSPPFCNPYQLHCNPDVFLLIMSVLNSLFPARIDWSCPMHTALYLCSHNPQARQVKIVEQPQRTHKSHIHCVLEKSFKIAVRFGVQKKPDNKAELRHPNLFFFTFVIFVGEECFSSITHSVAVFDPE